MDCFVSSHFLSATCSTNLLSCNVNKMIPGYLFINNSNASNVLMSKKLVGSSKINTFACVENNTANDNLVRSPPLKTLQERVSASFNPKLFKIALLKDSDESVSSIKYCNKVTSRMSS